jgi:hypothetical protein
MFNPTYRYYKKFAICLMLIVKKFYFCVTNGFS